MLKLHVEIVGRTQMCVVILYKSRWTSTDVKLNVHTETSECPGMSSMRS